MPKYYHSKAEFKIIPKGDIENMIGFSKSRKHSVIIILVWLTGARIGEVLELKRRDVDIDIEEDEFRIRLMTEKVEDHPMRELTFGINETPFLKETVIPYIESKEDEIFDRMGKRRSQQLLQEINKKTGYYYTFHEMRHSRLTYLGRVLRASVSELLDWTGWASSSELGTYHIRGAAKRFKDEIR